MKQILKKTTFITMSLWLFVSCSNDSIDTYSGRDSIYFPYAFFGTYINSNSLQKIDSLGISMAYEPNTVTDTIFPLPVMVQGNVSASDRTYKISADPSSTAVEGIHYTLPEKFVFRANSNTDFLSVSIHRTPEMKTDTLYLKLKLEANEFFNVDMQDKVTNDLTGEKISYTEFTLSINDVLSTPRSWFSFYLGEFTAKKIFLMSDLLGFEPISFNQEQRLGLSLLQYYGAFMQRYLNGKKLAGETVYEEDGTEMIMGPGVQ